MSPERGFGVEGPLTIGDAGTALDDLRLVSVAVDPANLLANTSANVDVAVAGAKTTDLVFVNPPADLEHGLVCIGASVPADGTVRLRLSNVTAGAIDGASKTWKLLLVRVAT